LNNIREFELVLQALRAESGFDEKAFVGYFLGAVLAMLTDFQFEQAIHTAHQLRAQHPPRQGEGREQK